MKLLDATSFFILPPSAFILSLMDALLRIWAIFAIAVKRLFSQRRLALLTALGLTVAIALTLSVPLYADAVYYRVLNQALSDSGGQATERARPPFAFMYRYIGSWHEPLTWDAIQPADQYFATQAGATLGLAQQQLIRFFKTDNFALFPDQTDAAYLNPQRSLAWVAFATVSGIEDHITLREGRLPVPQSAGLPVGGPVEVAISEELAATLGVHPGETFVTYGDRAAPNGKPLQIQATIVGVWQAADPHEDFWFYEPSGLANLLLVPEQTLLNQVFPRIEKPVYLALWYLVLDGAGVRASDAGPLLGRITAASQQAAGLLPNTTLDVSPVEALERYEQAASVLTILLYAFSVPILGLILAFIGLVVGLTVGQQRNEIAVLRSRGATLTQVVGIAGLEALVLGGLALAAGWPAGEAFAQAIGRARSFLNFDAGASLAVRMTLPIFRFGLAMAALALITQLAPTLAAARHTIITYKQERARVLRRPWWQRAWLDVLLLIPVAYGIYLLRQQGSIVPIAATLGPVSALLGPVSDRALNDPFQNPLFFLIPSLGVFALTLLILRVLPWVMAVVVWLAGHTKSVGLLMAGRHLARTPGVYTAPLVLLVLTLSLSAFTASLAQTLDNHLYDQTYYQVGGDMRVEEMGESKQDSTEETFANIGRTSTGQAAVKATDEGPRWLFLPVTEYLKAPGVQAAARVGRYPLDARLGAGRVTGAFIGVERTDFGRVAFWRRDFAPSSLGALMNALATTPEGVLVPRSFMAQYAINPGDSVRVSVSLYGQSVDLDLKVVGSFDLFPTWYPEEGPLLVGNLENLFEQAGGQYPYSVWLKTDACDADACRPADYERIVTDLNGLGLRIIQWNAALREIATEQRRPERQGLFGLLSVGFLAAALLTVIGFLLYALFSFRRRTIELGILRAIGLSASQMTAFLAWELAFLILTGAAAGTGFGAWISHLFIPYLQVGSGPSARVPPFLVEIAWSAIFRIYALFGLLFVAALVVLVFLLLRMKIFQAIKLGETV